MYVICIGKVKFASNRTGEFDNFKWADIFRHKLSGANGFESKMLGAQQHQLTHFETSLPPVLVRICFLTLLRHLQTLACSTNGMVKLVANNLADGTWESVFMVIGVNGCWP